MSLCTAVTVHRNGGFFKKEIRMNLFDFVTPDSDGDEDVTALLERDGIRIERIVSSGQSSGWYDQREGEFVALISGEAELEFDSGECIRMSAGDTIFIVPHKRHRVKSTSKEPPCVWLCVFFSE